MAELIVRPLSANELPATARTVADALAPDNERLAQVLYHRYAQVYPKRPDHLSAAYRAVIVDGQLAAVTHLSSHTLRYGRAAFNVVRVNTLLTFPAYRGQGFAGALLRDTLTHAAEQGAQLVLTQSAIPNFFDHYGFSPVWPEYTLSIDSQQAAKLTAPYQLRTATRDDLPFIATLYNRHWGRRVTTERNADLWRWLIEYRRDAAAVAVDGIGQIRGYIWHPDESIATDVEAVADNADAIETLLAYGGRRWSAAGCATFAWQMPPDDAIIAHAQHLLPITLSARYAPNSGPMGRVIDADGLVRRLLPEIGAQAQIHPARLMINVEPDGVDIHVKGMPDSDSRLALRDFMQLVFGSLRPETLALRAKLSDGARQLLATLFPPRVAALGAWDH